MPLNKETKPNQTKPKPKIYICYVDDILIATHSYDKINKLK